MKAGGSRIVFLCFKNTGVCRLSLLIRLGGSLGMVLMSLLGTTAYGQVVLDDFSVDEKLHYNFIPIFPTSGPDGWTVSSGQLRPNVPSYSTFAWLWNRGEKLFQVGDSVGMTLYVDWNQTQQSTGV